MTGDPSLRADLLENNVGGDLGDHNASGEQLGTDIDLVGGNLEVFGDGGGQRTADVAAIELESEEGQSQNRQEDEINP